MLLDICGGELGQIYTGNPYDWPFGIYRGLGHRSDDVIIVTPRRGNFEVGHREKLVFYFNSAYPMPGIRTMRTGDAPGSWMRLPAHAKFTFTTSIDHDDED